MSEKKRQKKDGERKDKKNKAMREAVSERGQQEGADSQQTSENMEPGRGATDNARRTGGNRQG